MKGQKNYIDFNATTVPLQESNLIEASAGTGKTYSIAILVLRLVLEEKLPIKEILMVTFTKAAVAELEERIRLFIRSGYKYAIGKAIEDKNIKTLVDRAVEKSSAEAVEQQLKDAVLFLDETSVLTIHSFCQQALNEFAFETNQLFGAEMLPDFAPVIEEELNKFWRKQVTTLSAGLLEYIWNEELRGNIQKILENHLSGKRYPGFNAKNDYTITKAKQEEWRKSLFVLNEEKKAQEESLHNYISENNSLLQNLCEGNSHAKKSLLPCLESPKDFVTAIREKRDKGYVTKLFPDILIRIDAFDTVDTAMKEMVQTIHWQLYFLAIQEAGKGIALFKERNNLLSYDDLINNLHQALVKKDNPKLVEALRNKYKAVFIDEFQDTDRQQFEIFDKAFGDKTILFYIGDPKQSIYAWRKADIFTYFKARNAVKHLYSMNHNYRSSEQMIDAMNKFFLPADDFDTFFFENSDDAIHYMAVESPVPNTKGLLLQNGDAEPAFSVFSFPNKRILSEAVAAQVGLLLQDQAYLIDKKGTRRGIKPSDIGILVRTSVQGNDVKVQLARLGIPAVTIDDSKVLQSAEARYLLYLMEAIAAPDRSSINRALLSPFTGFGTAEILTLDDGAVLELFTKYKSRWQQDGIYTALMDFVTDFKVRQVLLPSHTENGERIITNLFQLIELIHQSESRKNLSIAELISWLKRGVDGMSTEGDEYTQRMESDDDAVRIVTIHKSKGLEYNIVLAPFLDFVENTNHDFISFRDPANGDYVGAERSRLSEEELKWQAQQAEQENRRLLYVAITRAVYKCYIFKNLFYKTSTLATFLNALKESDPSLIKFEEEAPPAPMVSYRKAIAPKVLAAAQPVRFVLQEENWRKMSYSMLAAKLDHRVPPRSPQQPQAYDNFIFHTLRRGAKTGNFLHFIFENISFSDDSRWDKWLEEAVRRFAPGQQEIYLPMLREMLQQVLHTNIGGEGKAFTLSDIAWNKRMTEFEFDFPVPLFPPEKLNFLSDGEASVLIRNLYTLPGHELEGIMNGKIDLFFEYAGRYYILDWKSNYLGNELADYSPAALAKTMNDNNYHLQYLIYTLAVKKYLESRLPHFDYATQFGGIIYVFVRGVRTSSEHGIFTHKPSLEKILTLEKIIGKENTI
jgi:exodeoxyribonuclease V beta subunit